MLIPDSRPNILLVNPWIYNFTAYNFWLSPLGLLYAAALVRRHSNARLHFLDCLNRVPSDLGKTTPAKPDGRGPFLKTGIDKPSVLRGIPRKYSRYGIPISVFRDELARLPVPDVVLVTGTMTYWYPGVQLAVGLIRERFGSVPIVLGGIYATLCEEHARRTSGADVVVSGTAEKTLLPVLRKILGNAAVGEADIRSFPEMPRPDVGLLDDKTWLPVLSSRGCPFRCAFCAGPRLYDGFEQREPADVADEIAGHHRRFGTRHFAFYDDELLVNKARHVVPLLEEVARRKLPLAFHTPNGLHVREIDQPLAHLLRRAGVSSLYLSQESFDPRVIGEFCPKVEERDLERAMAYLEIAGYARPEVSVYLIAGLPGQSAESVMDGVRFVRKLGAKPRVAFFSPIPGTPVWEELVRRGTFLPDADPLLHNKLTFPYLWGDFTPDDFAALRGVLEDS